jgi:hypothetical protein
MMIAVDGNTKLVYEGQACYGYGLSPSPVLSLATVIYEESNFQNIPAGADLFHADTVFREDSFDPVTRIRRGRLYKTPGIQPQEWRVIPNAMFQGVAGQIQMRLHGFDSNLISSERDTFRNALIALGSADAYTLWRVVSVERIITGEDLLTLRARSSLGIVPEINESTIPLDAVSKVKETLTRLSDAAYRAGPESIVDRAKDAAQWCVAVWLADRKGDPKFRTFDLGKIANALDGEERSVIQNVGRALARLHARGKPNVQEEKGSRPVTEDDAEFALASVGILLREIGWSRAML